MQDLVILQDNWKYLDEFIELIYLEWQDEFRYYGYEDRDSLKKYYKDAKNMTTYLLFEKKELIGCYTIKIQGDVYFCDLFVKKNKRKQGIGKALIQNAKNKHNTLYLICDEKLTLWYEESGFQVINNLDRKKNVMVYGKESKSYYWIIPIIILIVIIGWFLQKYLRR